VSIHRPRWFREDQVLISAASTCGISKSGGSLVVYDSVTGASTEASTTNFTLICGV
jgi:hypothetical protein